MLISLLLLIELVVDLIFDRLKLLFEREVEIERLPDLLFGRELHEEEI